ncbi:MAG TPA: transcriptional regulator, partial [Cupriavidus sp.]|nr:transcriptional regulator [Cupriavidus sp.]
LVGREIPGALQVVADRAQAAMDATLSEITIASMLGEVEHAARRRKR